MSSGFKLVLALVALLIAAIAALMVVNTLRLRNEPIDVDVEHASIDLPAAVAANRLAGALVFRTVSEQAGTVSDPAAFRALHAYLEQGFPRAHAALERETVNRFSLLYTWRGADPSLAPVVLMAHLDVVPVADAEQWSHPPFSGDVAGGYIWGRGALDNKSGVTGILEAVEWLLGHGFTPERTIYLAFGHDEEIGGGQGAAAIAGRLAARRVEPFLILDEGGAITHGLVPGVRQPVALIGIADKGYVSLELIANAPGGHSSMPPARTAIGRLSRAIVRLRDSPFPARLTAPTRRMLSHLAPHLPFFRRLVLANLWLTGPLVLANYDDTASGNAAVRTTIAPTVFHAGVKDNVLPGRARAVVNFRILPGATPDSVKRRVTDLVAGTGVEVRALGSGFPPSPISPTDGKAFSLLAYTLRQTQADDGLIVAPYLVLGATDSRHYRALSENIYRLLPLGLGPDDLERIHGVDERISVEGYAGLVRFYVQLMRNLQADVDDLLEGPSTQSRRPYGSPDAERR